MPKENQSLEKAYKLYFDCPLVDQDKNVAPHIACITHTTTLTEWLKGEHRGMPFAGPMVWCETKDRFSDCYFCLTNIAGRSSKTRRKIKYPNTSSVNLPVPRNGGLTVSVCNLFSDVEEYCLQSHDTSPQLFYQKELNGLVCDLKLSKQQAEFLL
ncbi:hypothetical protein J437_LFUL004024 [Ladona fulva]|uniref:Uncharacterized protein n=1 Tax=Ladona fulva TaxID=123851 RepID=A0A8K0JZV4_LADFU|nr:hypothetical protein J437_LFUL004024 [Ladona fulva]